MEEHVSFWADPATWVSLAVTLFFVLIIWKKIPAIFAKMLDERSVVISEQLENARSLREEAGALLAKYERDQHAAEKQAADLMANAEAEIKLIISDSKAQTEEITKRRSEIAEQKIAQAEAAAIKEIKSLTINVATSAARELIEANLKSADHDALIKSSTDNLDAKLH
ncbi:MAG: ATP F0F1 synthase subunit B [Kordiimonadaceae bacterium]|jgi:F-type H+-transporting ATPase subunit b|nr:ATP F0F1 synthase subunit B [Kordiimonadaceae bacterium]MBT6032937.1 ATP F0F1 synthase subunit B [Kordiimonadaceae bacterium]